MPPYYYSAALVENQRAKDDKAKQVRDAAPELLEACKAALEVVTDDVIQALLNGAIAKAEGAKPK